jgi:hypothetical protein
MATIGVDNCSAPAGHGADEAEDSGPGDRGPLLDNSLAKLRGCGWPGLSPVEPPLKLIPQMFNGIKIRTLGRPGYDSDVVLLEIVLGDPCSVRGGVILLENEVSTPREKGRHMGDQHLLDIAVGIDPVATSWTNILEDYRSNKRAPSHPAPDHHSWASPRVPLNHTCVVETLSSPPPHSDAPIRLIYAEPALIREEDPAPLSITPVEPGLSPLESGLTVSWRQD